MPLAIYRITWTPRPGALGTQLDYKAQNGTSWITPASAPNPTTLNYFDLALTKGLTYYVRLTSIGAHCSPKPTLLTIQVPISGNCCPVGFSISADGSYCYQDSTVAPSITQSNICFALSQLAGQYSSSGTKLMDPGYDLRLNGSSTLLTSSYWKEAVAGLSGPMNREGVWIDANCDGTLDALSGGAALQYTYPVTLPSPATLYIGIAGDNTFEMALNGTVVVSCDQTHSAGGVGATANFNFWYLFPVAFPSGTSYASFKSIGDGTTQDCFANVIYNNTAGQLSAATSDGSLNILFKTSTLRGGRLDIATCPNGYFLDTTGGHGSYVCRKRTTQSTYPC